MPLKIIFLSIFIFGCSTPNEVFTPSQDTDSDDVTMVDAFSDVVLEPDVPDISNCVSVFSSCVGGATLVVGQDDAALIPFVAFSTFEDGTSLVFHLRGEAEILEGDVKLADASKERALPPMAGLVEPRENDEVTEIIWHSLGDTIQVSFPRPDFMKIIYDIELADVHNLSRPYRRISGTFTAPISVRCYTGVPGSGEGVRDTDFSSEFCQKYVKHNHVFPVDPIDDDG